MERKIIFPEYSQNKHLESFRGEIVRAGEDLLQKLKQIYKRDDFRYYLHTNGTDMSRWGALKPCLATIDEWILNDPAEAQTLSVKIEGREYSEFGEVCINLLERSISHDESKCYLEPNNILALAPELYTGSCGLFALATDIATYYSERVKRSIEGFAKLDKLLREK